jgi:NAD(P)H-hydrate epimerase
MELSAQRVEAAKTLVEKWSGVVVLKGQETVIASSEQTVINATGGPVLAKGGSGDVLTGLIAGLWAQALASGRVTGDASFLSAALGVYLHGRAGEFAERKLTAWACSSTDLIDYLPEAFRSL